MFVLSNGTELQFQIQDVEIETLECIYNALLYSSSAIICKSICIREVKILNLPTGV